jgi:hypothetical protein
MSALGDRSSSRRISLAKENHNIIILMETIEALYKRL